MAVSMDLYRKLEDLSNKNEGLSLIVSYISNRLVHLLAKRLFEK